jgi:hypothetical protein
MHGYKILFVFNFADFLGNMCHKNNKDSINLKFSKRVGAHHKSLMAHDFDSPGIGLDKSRLQNKGK